MNSSLRENSFTLTVSRTICGCYYEQPIETAQRARTRHQGKNEGGKCPSRETGLLLPLSSGNGAPARGSHFRVEPSQMGAAVGSLCQKPLPKAIAKTSCWGFLAGGIVSILHHSTVSNHIVRPGKRGRSLFFLNARYLIMYLC